MSQSENEPLLRQNSTLLSNQHHDVENTTRSVSKNALSSAGSLTLFKKISYGLGHVYNDLCAAMWFSYTLLFLQAVLELEATIAGSMMLLGQLVDALATPIIGYLADRWGSKRFWHFGGSFLVLFSFPLIFSRCLGCWISTDGNYLRWWQPFYYGLVIIFFQCGWAIVQISHLAMIPELTENLKERSELTAIRYTASVCSGVTVYLITWGVLHVDSMVETELGPTDDYKFRDISLFVTAIGCLLSILFHIGLRKHFTVRNQLSENDAKAMLPSTTNESSYQNSPSTTMATDRQNNVVTSINLSNGVNNNLLLSPILYQTALLYVASRLFYALSLVYVPLYLDERLDSAQSMETVETIASVPLATYISSFFTSLLLKYRSKYINHKFLYIIGSLICIAVCAWIATWLTPSSGPVQLYTMAAFLGIGSSITMVTSLCITADMIGPHSDQGAIVYSVVTFADKLITGIVVVIIENFKCKNKSDCPEYYRNILAYVCGGSATLGAMTMLICEISLFIRLLHQNKLKK